MRVIGIGVDVADPLRFARLLAHGGDRFRRRWFAPEEIGRCENSARPDIAFALHYAAKEATWKALHPPSWRDPLPWRDIVIVGDLLRGPSTVKLSGRAHDLAVGVRRIHVTGSVVRQFAVANALAEGE